MHITAALPIKMSLSIYGPGVTLARRPIGSPGPSAEAEDSLNTPLACSPLCEEGAFEGAKVCRGLGSSASIIAGEFDDTFSWGGGDKRLQSGLLTSQSAVGGAEPKYREVGG